MDARHIDAMLFKLKFNSCCLRVTHFMKVKLFQECIEIKQINRNGKEEKKNEANIGSVVGEM